MRERGGFFSSLSFFILRNFFSFSLSFCLSCSGIVAQSKENTDYKTLADYRLINSSVRQSENSIFFFYLCMHLFIYFALFFIFITTYCIIFFFVVVSLFAQCSCVCAHKSVCHSQSPRVRLLLWTCEKWRATEKSHLFTASEG